MAALEWLRCCKGNQKSEKKVHMTCQMAHSMIVMQVAFYGRVEEIIEFEVETGTYAQSCIDYKLEIYYVQCFLYWN
jgi:hypothetical protein